MADDQTQELAAMLGDLPPDKLAAIIQALKVDADNAAATPVVAWPDAAIEHKVEALVAVIRRISAPAFHWIEEELQKFQALDSQKKKETAPAPTPAASIQAGPTPDASIQAGPAPLASGLPIGPSSL